MHELNQRARGRRALCLMLAGLALTGPAQAAAPGLSAIPFWRQSAGWWKTENTYFSPTLDYNIRSYNSLIHIEVDGRRVVETEHKFYSPSKLALLHGAGQAREGEGVEVVTVTTFEQVDGTGAVRQVAMSPASADRAPTIIQIFNQDTAQKIVRNPGETVDTYRMLISMPAPDKRYIANYGLISVPAKSGVLGDLRGFSTFDGTRVQGGDFEAARAALRTRNKVHAIVTAGPDHKPVAKRLD